MKPPTKLCFDCGEAFQPSTANSKRCRPCNSKRTELRERAGAAAHRAVRAGTLQRGRCEVCGKEQVDAHHDDYSQPLAVRWLCRSHHQQHHAKQYGVAIKGAL